MSLNIRTIIHTMILQMKNSFARPMFRFCLLINPIANSILVYYMFKNSGKDNLIAYVVMGAGLMGLWGCICFSSVGDINRERYSGTLSVIYTSPTKFQLIIMGKILGNTLLSLATFIISYIVTKLLSRGQSCYVNILYLLISILGTIISFIIISVGIAYILTLSRKTTLYMNCLEIPIILLCGFLFPVEILPNWVQVISNLLVPTWGIRLMRMSLEEQIDSSIFAKTLGILIIMNVIYCIGIQSLYRVIDKQVRIHATLEVS